jgi:hypothetical protein
MKTRSCLLLLAFAGCHEGTDRVRFANRPPVAVVDDRRDVPTPPAKRITDEDQYAFRVSFQQPIDNALDVKRHRHALGVNSIDEVPDSTWFTNRHGLTPEQVARGPVTDESPELHTPWKVLRGKFGGASMGFIIVDARGVKYLLKVEAAEYPEALTGTEAVISRLLWAAGLNVPEDEVVYFTPEQLALEPGGRVSAAQVNKILGKATRTADGRYRALASRWIEGTPLGAAPSDGVRGDDPNDRIPHERRRDLRGMSVFYAWVDMTDVWPGNFLDAWTEDHGRHYVLHYMLDFDSGFGLLAIRNRDLRLGHEYTLDWAAIGSSTSQLGFDERRWENRPRVNVPAVAMTFTAGDLDPGHWRAALQYTPFDEADRFDSFWGAKILAGFTRAQIRAAVESGRFTDQRTIDYLTDTLVARQHKIVAYWYGQVNPLDHFAVGDGLCFDDLAVAQGYVPAGTSTSYELVTRDTKDRVVGPTVQIVGSPSGHTCVRLPALAANRGYLIVEVSTKRPGVRGTTKVHVARGGSLDQPRVIGIWRT